MRSAPSVAIAPSAPAREALDRFVAQAASVASRRLWEIRARGRGRRAASGLGCAPGARDAGTGLLTRSTRDPVSAVIVLRVQPPHALRRSARLLAVRPTPTAAWPAVPAARRCAPIRPRGHARGADDRRRPGGRVRVPLDGQVSAGNRANSDACLPPHRRPPASGADTLPGSAWSGTTRICRPLRPAERTGAAMARAFRGRRRAPAARCRFAGPSFPPPVTAARLVVRRVPRPRRRARRKSGTLRGLAPPLRSRSLTPARRTRRSSLTPARRSGIADARAAAIVVPSALWSALAGAWREQPRRAGRRDRQARGVPAGVRTSPFELREVRPRRAPPRGSQPATAPGVRARTGARSDRALPHVARARPSSAPPGGTNAPARRSRPPGRSAALIGAPGAVRPTTCERAAMTRALLRPGSGGGTARRVPYRTGTVRGAEPAV